MLRSALCAILASVLLSTGSLAQSALPLSVNVGVQPNDGKGDPLRTAFQKTMAAVNALYYQRAVANGLATLDGSGRLTTTQIPLTVAKLASPAFTGTATFATRPTFNGATPWDSLNFDPTLLAPKAGPVFSGSVTAPSLSITGAGSTGDVSGTSVRPPGASTSRTLAQMFSEAFYASLYGVTCNGIADDTAALQAVITTAQAANREIRLPPGVCQISGVTITGPVRIAGAGQNKTILELVSGSTASAVKISTPASLSPVNGYAHEVSLSELTIRSPNRDDAAGQGLAHGISLVAAGDGGSLTRLFLHNVSVDGVPGDGLRGNPGWKGFVESYGFKATYVGGTGIYANSVTDWRMFGGEVIGAKQDGVLLSGTTAMYFSGLNVYVNLGIDINVFNSGFAVIDNATIDLTAKHALAVNNAAGLPVRVSNSVLRWSGTEADATYSDLYIAGAGDVYLSNVIFADGATSISPNKPKFNIEFGSGSTGRAVASNVRFDRNVALSTIVSDTTRLVTETPNDLLVLGTAKAKMLTLSGPPAVTNIPASYWTVVKRTDDSSVRLCANDAGAIKCVTLN